MWKTLIAKQHRDEAEARSRNLEAQFLRSEPYKSIRELMKKLHLNHRGAAFSAEPNAITFGSKDDLNKGQPSQCDEIIRALVPWRKGPYDVFGHKIQSEWRSNIKWERIRSKLLPVEGKVVCDLGCNNGYMLFKLLPHNPKHLLGLDPCFLYRAQYELLSGFLKDNPIDYKLLGHEHLSHFEKVFDVVLCLGILYHHPDPIGVLRRIHNALKPKGKLLVDCQGIVGEGALALFPRKRYAGASGMWFLPTTDCLKHWLCRTGFREVDVFYEGVLTEEEQSRSLHSPHGSLTEGLEEGNPKRTIEGYPAPIRIYLTAFKG